jgi:hypothetical protein
MSPAPVVHFIRFVTSRQYQTAQQAVLNLLCYIQILLSILLYRINKRHPRQLHFALRANFVVKCIFFLTNFKFQGNLQALFHPRKYPWLLDKVWDSF